jgi:hypothetical protein
VGSGRPTLWTDGTPPPPVPTVNLSANPTSVASGGSSTLSWSSTNATSCNASGGWSGSRPLNGSAATPALTASTTFTLTCTGSGGSASQSATVTVTSPPGNIAGLNFPSNGSDLTDMRFRFRGSNLQPMYPLTLIFRVNLRRQQGYYTTFFWGPDGGFTGTQYYGAHPYPDGSDKATSTNHHWSLPINGGDPTGDANGNNTQVAYDTWHIQAFRAVDNGVNKVHEFYWDLPDTTKVIRIVLGRDYGPPSNPALTFGDAPWAIGRERLSGILRGMQSYNASLSTANILAEVNNPLSTSAGNANIWYLNLNPTPSDISDKSGRGHQPEWTSSGRPALWTP